MSMNFTFRFQERSKPLGEDSVQAIISLQSTMEQSQFQRSLPTTSQDLENHKAVIQPLYIDQDMTLDEVMSIMKSQYGLNASKSMYKKKIRKWAMYKPAPPDSNRENGLDVPRQSAVAAMRPNPANLQLSNLAVGSRRPQQVIGRPYQPIRHIKSPGLFQIKEEMFYAGRCHLSDRLVMRLQPPGANSPLSSKMVLHEHRQKLSNNTEIKNFGVCCDNASGMFAKGDIAMAMASLSQALARMKDLIQENNFFIIPCLNQSCMILWRNKMTECIPVILKQMYGMVSILHGNMHPLAIWSRTLLQLHENMDQLFEPMGQLYPDLCQELFGPDDEYTKVARATDVINVHDMRRYQKDWMAVEHTSQKIDLAMAQLSMIPRLSASDSTVALYYTVTMLNSKQFERTETYLLSTVLRGIDLDHLPPEDPIHNQRAWSYHQTLMFLGLAWSGQEKFDLAMKIFFQLIPMVKESQGPDAPFTIQVLEQFGIILKAQRLDDEARAVYADLDDRLLPYMM